MHLVIVNLKLALHSSCLTQFCELCSSVYSVCGIYVCPVFLLLFFPESRSYIRSIVMIYLNKTEQFSALKQTQEATVCKRSGVGGGEQAGDAGIGKEEWKEAFE